MGKLGITLAMIVKNEEKDLGRCLESAKNIFDEIVIVDTGSTDRTKEIAESYGAKIYDFEWINDFSVARNYATEKSTNEWIVFLDADEVLDEGTKNEISRFVENNPDAIGRFKFMHKVDRNGEVAYKTSYASRLYKKNMKFTGKIHEQVATDLPRKNVGALIFHDGYYKKEKSGRNIPLLLEALENDPGSAYYHFQLGREYKTDNLEIAMEYYRKSYGLLTKKEAYAPMVILELMGVCVETKKNEDIDFGLEMIDKEQGFLNGSPDFYHQAAKIYTEYCIATNDDRALGLIEKCYRNCLELGKQGVEEIEIGISTYISAHDLGAFYEVLGRAEDALHFYKVAWDYGYEPSKVRINVLGRKAEKNGEKRS